MSRVSTLTLAACGVVLAMLAPLALSANPANPANPGNADGQACLRRYHIDPQLAAGELTGAYPLSNGELLRVGREVARYYAEMPSTGRIEIVPVDDDLFVERNGPVRLKFVREAFRTEVVVTGLDGQTGGPPACPR
jgi:hypothetical protein